MRHALLFKLFDSHIPHAASRVSISPCITCAPMEWGRDGNLGLMAAALPLWIWIWRHALFLTNYASFFVPSLSSLCESLCHVRRMRRVWERMQFFSSKPAETLQKHMNIFCCERSSHNLCNKHWVYTFNLDLESTKPWLPLSSRLRQGLAPVRLQTFDDT